MTQQTRLTPKQVSPRALETQMAPGAVHISHIQFWGEIRGRKHALHLKQTPEENYTVTTEWDGKRCIGITLDWDYKTKTSASFTTSIHQEGSQAVQPQTT